MMKYSGIQTSSVLIIAVYLCFSPCSFSAGRSGFPVAKTLMSARSLALGGANLSVQSLGSGANLNPASVVGLGKNVAISHAQHTLDFWSGMVFLSAEIKPKLTGGFSLSTYNYGNFKVSEIGSGATGETFSAGEYILSGFVAGNLGKSVDIGISAKYLWGNIKDDSASDIACDLGAIWVTGWENVNLALVARNVGVTLKSYGVEENRLPSELQFGGSRAIKHLPLTIYAVLIASHTGEEDWTVDFLPGSPGIGFGVGGEFQVASEGKSQPMFLRMGYRSRGQGLQMGHRLDALAGYSFGVGFNIKNIKFDYTYALMGAFGDIHRFSFESNVLSKVL